MTNPDPDPTWARKASLLLATMKGKDCRVYGECETEVQSILRHTTKIRDELEELIKDHEGDPFPTDLKDKSEKHMWCYRAYVNQLKACELLDHAEACMALACNAERVEEKNIKEP